jgi:hypothetical protein
MSFLCDCARVPELYIRRRFTFKSRRSKRGADLTIACIVKGFQRVPARRRPLQKKADMTNVPLHRIAS